MYLKLENIALFQKIWVTELNGGATKIMNWSSWLAVSCMHSEKLPKLPETLANQHNFSPFTWNQRHWMTMIADVRPKVEMQSFLHMRSDKMAKIMTECTQWIKYPTISAHTVKIQQIHSRCCQITQISYWVPSKVSGIAKRHCTQIS